MDLQSDTPLASRGYSHLEMLSLEPVKEEIYGSSLIIIMGQAQTGAPIGEHAIQKLTIPTEVPSHLDETISRLVEEKREDLVALATMNVIEGHFKGEQPEIQVHDRTAFDKQINEITANISGEERNKVKTLVTQQCLKELWPLLCLQQNLKELKSTEKSLSEAPGRVIPKGKISKQVTGALKTTSLFLKEVGNIETLSKGKIEEKAWETQKLLAKNQSLQAQLDEIQPPSNEATVRNDVKKLETQVKQFLDEGRGDKESQSSWLGSLFDRGAAWIKWLTPTSIQNVISASGQLLASGAPLSQEERDKADFHFLQRYQGRIDALTERAQVLSDQAAQLKTKPLCEELEKITQTLKQYHDVTEYLDDYFVLDEAQQTATLRLTDQIDALEHGKCDFSADSYVGIIHQVQRFTTVGSRHKKNTQQKKLIEEIDKKTAYQNQQCLHRLEEFMEELLPAIRAESSEAIAQWDAANSSSTPEGYLALLDANIAREAVARACETFAEKLESLRNEQLPDVFLNKCQKDLQAIRQLQKELSGLPAAPEKIAEQTNEALRSKDISEYLNTVRNNRITISPAQQRREWEQREFEKLGQEGPPSRQLFLRCFFFYLQALAPIVGAFSTPIAKQDFDYCLKMMAKTSQSANASGESYDDYLNMARSFVGIDEEFLNNYDHFLRGQMQFTYNPSPISTAASAGMLPPGQKATTEQIYEWVEGVAPSGIAAWTASLLGLSPQGQAIPETNAWDQWVQSAIYPQAKNNYFSGVVNYFEQLDSSATPPSEGDSALFGYHCYQMYESLKTPEGQADFQTHRQQAAQFPQFRTFLNDYMEYLQAHAPQMSPLAPTAPETTYRQVALLPEVPLMMLEPVTKVASEVNGVFQDTLPANVTSFTSDIMTRSDLPVSSHIQATVDAAVAKSVNTLQVQLQQLSHLQAQFNGLPVEIPKVEELKAEALAFQGYNEVKLSDAKSIAKQPAPDVQEWLRDIHALAADQAQLTQKSHQLSLEEQKVSVEVLRKIVESPSLQPEERGLLHIIGDPFGRGTGLEGHTAMFALQSRLGVLQAKLKALQDTDKDGALKQIFQDIGLQEPDIPGMEEKQVIRWLEKALELHQILRTGSLKTFSHALEDSLRSAPPGEPILLPGGWTGFGDGHALYYEFTKQSNGDFSVRIYNTGAGLEYHPMVTSDIKIKAVAFIERVNVPLSNIIHPTLLKAMQELKTKGQWSAQEIYEPILKHIGGDPRSEPLSENDLRTPQRAGTCSFMSIATVLSYRMGSERAFLKSEFETGLKALVDYVGDRHKELEEGQEIPFKLLSKSAEEFARDVLDFHERGVINDLEQAYAQKKISEINEFLTTCRASTISRIMEAAPIVTIKPTPVTQLKTLALNPIFEPAEGAKVTPLQTQRHVIRTDDWVPLVGTAHSDLSNFQAKIQGAYAAGDFKMVVDATNRIAAKLPLGWLNSSEPLPSWENSQSIISALTAISKLAFQSQAQLAKQAPSRKDELPPSTFLAHAKILTVCHRLAKVAPEHLHIPDSAFLGLSTIAYLNGISPFLRTYNPEADEQIRRLATYWNNMGGFQIEHRRWWANFGDDSQSWWRSTPSDNPWEWTIPLIADPTVQAKMATRYPDWNQLPQMAQVAMAVSDITIFGGETFDNQRDVLPPFFYDLRDLLNINLVTIDASLDRISASEQLFSYQAIGTGEFDEKDTFTQKLQSVRNWGVYASFEDVEWNDLGLQKAHRAINDSEVLSLFVTREWQYLYKGVKRGLIRRPNPDEDLTRRIDPSSSVPNIEEQRHLSYLAANENLQVRETLAHFMSPLRSSKLEKPDYQALFQILFFDPQGLFEEVRGNQGGNFIRTANRFFQQQYQTYAELQNWDTATYFLGMSQTLEQYVEFFKKNYDLKLPVEVNFLDVQAELRSILKQRKTPDDVRAMTHLELALTYQGMSSLPTVESAKELLSSIIQYKQSQDTLQRIPRDKELALESMWHGFAKDLLALQDSPEQLLALLNGVAALVQPRFEPQEWLPHPAFPLFIAKDGSCAIDLLEAEFFNNYSGPRPLPQEIKSHPLFDGFGNDFVKQSRCIGGGWYEFETHDGSSYRAAKIGWETHVQKLIERDGQARWYQYLPKTGPSSAKDIDPVLQLKNTHWYSTEPAEILVLPPKSVVPRYQLDLSPDVQEIRKLDDRGHQTGLRATENPLVFLNDFENKDYIIAWQRADGQPNSVELPRFNISFTFKEVHGEIRAYCSHVPGYYLAKQQWISALKGFPNALLLKNQEGQEKVLIADQLPKKTGSSLDTHAWIRAWSDGNTQSHYSYSIDKSTGRLIPTNDAARFYLATVYLMQQNYTESMAYLRGDESSQHLFSSDEKKLLNQIVNLDKISLDSDPKAISLSLYAAYLLKKNATDFIKPDRTTEPPVEVPQHLLSRYLNVLDKTAPVTLHPSEEIFLLSTQAKTESERNRLRALIETSSLDRSYYERAQTTTVVEFVPPPAEYPKAIVEAVAGGGWVAFHIFYSGEASSPPPSVFRPAIEQHLVDAYRMVKGELSPREFHDVYLKLTGVSLPDDCDMRKAIEMLLDLSRGSIAKGGQSLKGAMGILQATFQEPRKFPSGDLLAIPKSDAFIRDKVIEPALEILKAPSSEKLPSHPPIIPIAKTPAIPNSLEMPFQSCVAPYQSSRLMEPCLQELDRCLEKICLPVEQMTHTYDELVTLFQPPQADRVVQKEFSRVQASLRNYEATAGTSFYSITDHAAFSKLKGDLDQQIVQGESVLDDQLTNLLQMANETTSSTTEVRRQLEAIGHGKNLLKLDDLVQLFLRRDMVGYHKANPDLSPDDVYELNHAVMEYLIQATHVQHLKRLASQMTTIQKAEGVSENDLSVMLQTLSTAASTTRAYTVEDQPEYLVFEYYMDILMRPEQVTNLDLLRIRDGVIQNPEHLGVVLEMIMGSGKTAVLLPLLGLLNADGDALSMGVIPRALLRSMVQELSVKMDVSFEQAAEILDYSRNQKLTSEDLRLLRIRLETIRTDKKMLFMSSETVQGLYLSFIETWRSYAMSTGNTSEIEKQLDIFRDIFRLFKEKARVVVDESDSIWHSKKEYQFTVGAPQALPIPYTDLVTHLYEILLLNPEVAPNTRFDFGGPPDGVAFTPQQYHETIAPNLVEHILQDQLGVTDSSVTAFFEKLGLSELDYLRLYLSSANDSKAIDFVRNIPNPLVKELLALAREEINVLIPLTANKILDVNYGGAPDGSTLVGIPYHGSNSPSLKSRYTQFETLNYTIQLGLAKDIPKDLIIAELEELQQLALTLKNTHQPYIGSDVQRNFLRLTGGDPKIKLFGSEDKWDLIAEKAKSDIDLKLYFNKKYRIPQVVNDPETLSANSQLFNYLFARVFGFSGSQWNADSFPERLQIIPSEIATAKTLALLWKNSSDKVHVVSKIDSARLAETLIGNHPNLQHVHAVIDTAALGRGASNKVHAQQFLDLPSNQQRDPPILGVVFYDDKDDLMILERGEDSPKLASASVLPPEQRFTLYDQKYTTGSDIKQAFDACAVVTIGKDIILRDVLQSVWRMRGLEHGQRVEFAVDDEAYQIITLTLARELNISISGPLELRHILLFATYNQAMEQGDNNFRSLKHKMKAVLQETALLAALDKSVPVADLKTMFLQVEELFVTTISSNAWDLFGVSQENRESEIVVKELLDKTLTKATPETKPRLEALAEKVLPTLPDHLPAADRAYGTEAEIEAETQLESQTQSKTQNEMQSETVTERDQEADLYKDRHYDYVYYPAPTLQDLESRDFFQEVSLSSLTPDLKMPKISLNSALANEPELAEFEGVFDPNLLGSLHLIRQGDVKGFKPTVLSWLSGLIEKAERAYTGRRERPASNVPYHLFNFFHKPVSDILIRKDASGFTFVLGDPTDGSALRPLVEQTSSLWLYRPGYGLDRHGVNCPDIENDPQFLKLMVQAKFFNGELNYSEEELPYLKAWVKAQGAEKMERLFQHIVKWKPSTRNAYPYSPLKGILSP